MNNLVNMLKCVIDGVEILPCNNGGIEVRLDPEGEAGVPAVLATVADAMQDYDLEDVQITTDQYNNKVYIDIVERED